MKNYESSDKVFEAYYSNFTAGCFRQGDVIKFVNVKDLKKSPVFKSMQYDIKNKFENMIASSETGDSVIMVWSVNLNPLYQSNYEASTISIGYSLGGGRVMDIISIPGSLGEFMHVEQIGANLPQTIPSGVRIDYDKRGEIKEIDMEELEKHRNDGYIDSTFQDIK